MPKLLEDFEASSLCQMYLSRHGYSVETFEPLSDKQMAIATWAFEDCDADHDGFITRQDVESDVSLMRALQSQGTSVDDFIASYDYNGDGQISLEEWIKFYTVYSLYMS